MCEAQSPGVSGKELDGPAAGFVSTRVGAGKPPRGAQARRWLTYGTQNSYSVINLQCDDNQQDVLNLRRFKDVKRKDLRWEGIAGL